jgi:Family of unknown function (DUF6879)
MLSETELDPFFDAARREAFRLEALPAYAVTVESAGLSAYLAGEPFQKSDAGQAFNEYVRSQVAAGVTWRRVRVVRGPLTDYERWECEWGYTVSEEFGHHTFVLDLTETAHPPELPGYDWWMFDERVVLRFHYDHRGTFLGADPIDDPGQVAEHIRYRDAALTAAIPFLQYWAAHLQYWRQNWLKARS